VENLRQIIDINAILKLHFRIKQNREQIVQSTS